MRYQERKNEIRSEAIAWQTMSGELARSWQEIASDCARFCKLAKRYGLIKEFKREGIL
jgi:hypothetical protein